MFFAIPCAFGLGYDRPVRFQKSTECISWSVGICCAAPFWPCQLFLAEAHFLLQQEAKGKSAKGHFRQIETPKLKTRGSMGWPQDRFSNLWLQQVRGCTWAMFFRHTHITSWGLWPNTEANRHSSKATLTTQTG